jgi:hypothetical protein
MGRHARQDHQPEPWMQDGRYILDASRWTLASARFPTDARRIVAAINAVQGIPTDALESWIVNVIGEPIERADAAGRAGRGDASESFPNERRMGERRHGDRRASRPELRIFGAESSYREDEEGKNSQ